LKQALASGQVKKIEPTPRPLVNKLDTSHELPIPEKELNLPLPEKNEVKEERPAPVAPAKTVIAQTIVRPFKPVSSAKPVEVAPAPQVAQPPVVKVAPVNPMPTNASPSFKTVVPPAPIVIPTPVVPKPVAAARPIFAPSILKQAMHDIKPVPKVMGPLEELQFLDLINFRRLGKTPAEITAKIFSKIKLLEADGYDKMVAGVRAWRQSPVNRLYLKMVQEAIGKGMTIKEYAVEIQKEKKDYLTIEEIEGILAMNSKLVF
jgi:hypothetical protein